MPLLEFKEKVPFTTYLFYFIPMNMLMLIPLAFVFAIVGGLTNDPLTTGISMLVAWVLLNLNLMIDIIRATNECKVSFFEDRVEQVVHQYIVCFLTPKIKDVAISYRDVKHVQISYENMEIFDSNSARVLIFPGDNNFQKILDLLFRGGSVFSIFDIRNDSLTYSRGIDQREIEGGKLDKYTGVSTFFSGPTKGINRHYQITADKLYYIGFDINNRFDPEFTFFDQDRPFMTGRFTYPSLYKKNNAAKGSYFRVFDRNKMMIAKVTSFGKGCYTQPDAKYVCQLGNSRYEFKGSIGLVEGTLIGDAKIKFNDFNSTFTIENPGGVPANVCHVMALAYYGNLAGWRFLGTHDLYNP